MPSLLFVCLGNICRSPLAEGALRAEAARRGLALTVDSAGTGNWHAGEAPDRRAQATARRHGVDISGLRARQVTPDDFRRFDHVIAIGLHGSADLQVRDPVDRAVRGRGRPRSGRGRAGQAVADPWFGDEAGFETTRADVTAAARALADALSA